MQLNDYMAYMTRDKTRRNICVRRLPSWCGGVFKWKDDNPKYQFVYTDSGRVAGDEIEHPFDLVPQEDVNAHTPFCFADCPLAPDRTDGRRLAVTRDGRDAVLLCDDMPGGRPIVGIVGCSVFTWPANGEYETSPDLSLRVPKPEPRYGWMNRYKHPVNRMHGYLGDVYETQEQADKAATMDRDGPARRIEL